MKNPRLIQAGALAALLWLGPAGARADGPRTIEEVPGAAKQILGSNKLAPRKPDAPKKDQARGFFKVVYVPPKKAEHKKWEKLIKESKFLEDNAKLLNDQFILPFDVPFEVSECGEANAFYSPDKHSITLCYEMFEGDAKVLGKVVEPASFTDKAVLSEEVYTLYHELGHALIDIYKIPAVGREEDAVDQLSTLTLLSSGEGGEQAISATIALYAQNGRDRGTEDLPFWDEHSLDHQRAYDMMCLMYGSDPDKHADMVADDGDPKKNLLPKSRAERCPDEYQKLDKAWDKLLEPHLRPVARAQSGGKSPS